MVKLFKKPIKSNSSFKIDVFVEYNKENERQRQDFNKINSMLANIQKDYGLPIRVVTKNNPYSKKIKVKQQMSFNSDEIPSMSSQEAFIKIKTELEKIKHSSALDTNNYLC